MTVPHNCTRHRTCTRPCKPAVNGLGWAIEHLEPGKAFIRVSNTYPNRCDATELLDKVDRESWVGDLRVYEQLSPPVVKQKPWWGGP